MSFGNPETVIVALAGQTVSGMETVAVVDWPAESVPLDGLMLMPFTPLPAALQDQSTWLFALAWSVRGQLHPVPAA